MSSCQYGLFSCIQLIVLMSVQTFHLSYLLMRLVIQKIVIIIYLLVEICVLKILCLLMLQQYLVIVLSGHFPNFLKGNPIREQRLFCLISFILMSNLGMAARNFKCQECLWVKVSLLRSSSAAAQWQRSSISYQCTVQLARASNSNEEIHLQVRYVLPQVFH